MQTNMTMKVIAAGLMTIVIGAQALAQGQPEKGGTLLFPIHSGEPETYDCHAASAIRVMQRLAPHYSQLVKLDPEHYPAVKGDLAKSWKVSTDGKTYEFKLNEKIQFHNGSMLTSNDVKVSYDRMRHPPKDVVSLYGSMLIDIESIETPDPSTVVFKLVTPNSAMLQLLAMPFACIYSAKLLAEDPSYPVKKVMGSGPFKFTRYVPGQEWVGERFDKYFRDGLPYLDGFRAISVTVPGALTALASGQVHFNVKALTDAELNQVKQARGNAINVVGVKTALPVTVWLTPNTEKPPLNDARVRRAINLALDRWQGSTSMRQFTPINMVGSLSRPGSPFAHAEKDLVKLPGFSRDIESSRKEARRLLAEAGQSNLKIKFLNNRNFSYFGVYVVDQLRQVGITVEHEMLDPATYIARRRTGSYDLTTDTPPEYLDDPTVQFSNLTSFKNNPRNTSRVNDSKLDVMYEIQKRTLDPKQRQRLVWEMESYVLDQGYAIPLFWGGWTRAISKTVGGLADTSTNYMKLDLSDIWLTGDKRP